MKNLYIAGILCLSSLFAFAQDSITEGAASSDPWSDETLKADLMRGDVTRGSKKLFDLERLGNAVFIKLPRKVNLMEVNMWVIEADYQGQGIPASWDTKKKAWKFNLMGRGEHKVMVSKRQNNLQDQPYAWFNVSF